MFVEHLVNAISQQAYPITCIGRLERHTLMTISLAVEGINLPIHGSTLFATFTVTRPQSATIMALSQ
jgi:hypothetical protein